MQSSAKRSTTCRTLFELIDSDRDGVITKRELMHAATMSEDCMAIMQTNERLQHLLQPQHFAESFKAMDIEHTGKITLDEFQTFAQHMHKKGCPEKGKAAEGKTPADAGGSHTSRPSSRASSAFDEALEESLETGEEVAAEEELEEEEPEVETKVSSKPKMEDLTREERRALAMKKAQARRSNVQIGQRKVHLKIKKAAKSVQGDIDAAKKRLGKSLPCCFQAYRPHHALTSIFIYLFFAFSLPRICALALLQHWGHHNRGFSKPQTFGRGTAQASKRPGTKTDAEEFLRRQNNRRAARRKEKEEKKFGVKTSTRLYGRMEKESLHEGDFDTRQKKSLLSHINYPNEFRKAKEEQERWLNESMDFFRNWIYPLRKVFSNYSRDFMPQRTTTIDFDELQKLKSGLTISDWMIFVNDFELMPWQVTKTQALAIFHYSNLKLGGGIAIWARGAARKLYRSKSL